MPWLAEDSAQGHACPCAESRFSAFTDLVAACFDQCISRSTISTLPQEIVAPTDAIVNWQFLQSKPRTPRLDSRHCAERPDLCAWIHQGLFARIYVSAQFAPISQKNQLGCLIMCCTSVCRGISIQCRQPRPYLAESLAECRGRYRPAGHLRVAELSPESTEARPPSKRKPEHHPLHAGSSSDSGGG
jgi:hypothetical protein